MGEFVRRVAFAAVAIPAVAAVVWAGGLLLAALLGALAAVCAWEFYRLAGTGGVRTFSVAGIALAALVPLVVHTNTIGVTAVPMAAGALVLLALFTVAVWRRVSERPMSVVGSTLFGIAYAGGMLSYGYLLRHHRFVVEPAAGLALVGLPLLLTWATDTGGYAFGKMIGGRKLMPVVSPGKTVAGAVGGVVLAVAVVAAYVPYVLRPVAQVSLPIGRAIAFAILISATAQLGDLAESLLKREAGVKDSSRLIPGHGGVLDRLDSLLFVLPVSYVLLNEMLVVVL
ncbi:MAG TPA: CDP-archaeol synthase [Gemmatimonadaceae bacterium]|nr:CDP-archaeol synthase [Gemmatimonadaceae bacterium]